MKLYSFEAASLNHDIYNAVGLTPVAIDHDVHVFTMFTQRIMTTHQL